jgi:hypothetical protein
MASTTIASTVQTIIFGLFNSLSESVEWFTRSPSKKTMYHIAEKIIVIASDLQRIIEAENTRLQEDGADAYFEFDDLNVVLYLNNKREHFCFSEQNVEISRTNRESDRMMLYLQNPPDEDGYTYFLHSLPCEFGRHPYAIQLTKKQATFLKKKIEEIEAEQYGLV